MIKILLECFNFIKQLIDSNDKKDFINKNVGILKNCLIILLSILFIVIIIMYIINIVKKSPINTVLQSDNSNILIQLEVPANINAPFTLKVSKSN